MSERSNPGRIAPEGYAALGSLEDYLHGCGLETSLLELVKVRASQINACAYCLDMHTKDARAQGESEQRLYGLSAWREAPYYTPRERAALAWTEAVTRLAVQDPSDELYEALRENFGEKEAVDLSLAICAINSWNRMAVAFRKPAGTHRPKSDAS